MMTRWALATFIASTVPACASDDPQSGDPEPPQVIADRVGSALADVAGGEVTADEIEYRIYDLANVELEGDVTPESCDAVDQRLVQTCDQLYSDGATSCWYLTSFYYANDVPRCAVRFVVGRSPAGLPDVYAMDFTGTPLDGPAPDCGNGDMNDGEMCDDGNHEAWDGCDPNCQTEEFEGCEAVIEGYYAEAGLAHVDKDAWSGPRSHLMVNDGDAMVAVDQSSCNAAIALGTDVCAELQRQMAFVNWCQPSGELHGDACSVRLEVGFSQLEPATGVFTTALPGILAFTIR